MKKKEAKEYFYSFDNKIAQVELRYNISQLGVNIDANVFFFLLFLGFKNSGFFKIIIINFVIYSNLIIFNRVINC